MKAISFLCVLFFMGSSGAVLAQENVGIGVATPTEALSVARGLNIDFDNQNPGASLLHGLKFGNPSLTSQMTGISSARLGTSPFSLDFYTGNSRRMMITQGGLVGINAMPTSYFLEVGGTIKGLTLRSAGSVYAEGGNVVSDGSVSAGTNIIAANAITATAGNITASAGDIVATDGELRADGRGVLMSNNSTRQKVVAYTANLSVNSLAPGSSVTGIISINSGTFSAAPTAYVGNVIVENGDYYKAMLVLENVTTTNITVRIVNPTASNISFTNAQWKVLAIGAF